MSEEINNDAVLAETLASFEFDPLGFVLWAFPWGEGELKGKRPEKWQVDILLALGKGLITIEEAIKLAVASGHGIGKSACIAWIILWAISTKEGTKGVVTSNTETQLRTKTWAELSKWHNLFIAKSKFTLTATAIFSSDPEHAKTWRIDCIPWSINNTEAFAGLHNQGKRIILIFDEASAIDDKIWEVSEGALTDADTQIIWVAFGNPTRTTGRFRECFRKYKHRWLNWQIDSRTVTHSNKVQIKSWLEDYGEDSDFFRVRVRGEFPNASVMQFIPIEYIEKGRKQTLNESMYKFAPTIIGVDPAWSGDDDIVIFLRQGLFSKVLATYKKNNDDFKLAQLIMRFELEHDADAVFIDQGYGTGVYSAGIQLGRSWILVNFGGGSDKIGFANKRAEMWDNMKNWLRDGGSLPDDPGIHDELASPEYEVKLNGEILLESKKDMKARGVPSPNKADALALTFAYPVVKRPKQLPQGLQHKQEYDPFSWMNRSE